MRKKINKSAIRMKTRRLIARRMSSVDRDLFSVWKAGLNDVHSGRPEELVTSEDLLRPNGHACGD